MNKQYTNTEIDNNVRELKRNLRKKYISERNALDLPLVLEKSKIIMEKVLSLEQFRTSNLIMAYMDFRNEVHTADFLKFCIQSGKRVALPRVESSIMMNAYEVENLNTGLEKSAYGIHEPIKELNKLINPKDIDFIIVPGVAFDLSLTRLGYGGGYYDGFMVKTRKDCIKAGVAFEVQVIDSFNYLPFEEHDVKLDMIITEKRIIKMTV